MATRHYSINGEDFGSSDESTLDAWDDPCLWYCTKCGMVYAQARMEGKERRERMWVGHRGCCETCIPQEFFWNQIPGSLWSYEGKRNEYLPYEVLRRELLLTIKAMERGEL